MSVQNKTGLSRGLSRMVMMIAGVSALMMIAGSAQALSIDLSSYRGGNAEFKAGGHTVNVVESRSRRGRSVSISINGGKSFSVASVSAAVRRNTSVVAVAGDTHRRLRARRRSSVRVASFKDVKTDVLKLYSRNRIRLGKVHVDVPTLPATAVPEPGAALLFGAGIVMAGLRRR